MEIYEKTVLELRELLKKKLISGPELGEIFRQRALDLNPKTRAMIHISRGPLVSQHPEGPLAWIPMVFKDVFCTRGIPTTAGSRMLKDFVPPYSAHLVQKSLDAGAILVGKTNMDEFAMGSSGEYSFFGAVPNPHDGTRVSRGSSSGSAVAVATGLAPMALGSDTGGSVRLPASFCGVFGLKPTYGKMSRRGMIACASSLDQAGVFARSVGDLSLITEILGGHDPLDATSCPSPFPFPSPSPSPSPSHGAQVKKIGIPRQIFHWEWDPEVVTAFEKTLDYLKKSSYSLVEVDLPNLQDSVPCYYLIAMAEASSNLSRYDGIRFGYRGDFAGRPPENLEEFLWEDPGRGLWPRGEAADSPGHLCPF